MIDLKLEKNDDNLKLYLSGRLDSTNADDTQNKIDGFNLSGNLTIDFKELEFISSAGLRILLKLRKAHPELKIENVNTDIYEVLEMTGFTEMIDVQKAFKEMSIEGCEIIGRGANGDIYRVSPDTVVKVYKNNCSLDDIKHEREVARKALIYGVPTAISFDLVLVDGCYASVFEMIDAKSLSSIISDDPENLDKYAKDYAELLKSIHNIEVPKGELTSQKTTFINWMNDIKGTLPDEVYNKYYKLVTEIPESDNMIHGDFHTKNILVQNGEAIIIDMDTLAVGNAAFEFAFMYTSFIGHGLVDKNSRFKYIGLKDELCTIFFEKVIMYYFNLNDISEIEQYENKATAIGLLRLYRRTITKTHNSEHAEVFKKELIKLYDKLDSLAY